jgi:YidC/Oxa1 family membrane protein insertase
VRSLTHAIGGIFQPILKFIADILAFFFALIPSYPVDVALLTIVVMAALTPLTVKSTKNMAAMQALGPEMKKLQAKYKGPDNRAALNEEMMKLYKEHNVNPASGCLPMLLQMPFFFMLYSVIRGITNTVSKGTALPYTYNSAGFQPTTPSKCESTVCALPRYISPTTQMYHHIVAAHGQLISGGMNFAAKLLSHHSSPLMYIPYALLVLGAVGLQYLQMARLNARNPQANQANPQAAMLQKYMPLIFGFIYLNVAAILNVYFIISSAIRIATQEVLFRKGIVPGPGAPPAGAAKGTGKPSTPAADGSGQKSRSLSAAKDKGAGVESTEKALPKAKSSGGTTKSPGGTTKGVNGTARGTTKGSGTGGNGSKPSSNGSNNGGSANGSGDGSGATEAVKPHPRSKAKKERKAR